MMQFLTPDGMDILNPKYVKPMKHVTQPFQTIDPAFKKPILFSYGLRPFQLLGDTHIPQWVPTIDHVEYSAKHAEQNVLENFQQLRKSQRPSMTQTARVLTEATICQKVQENTEAIAERYALTLLPETGLFTDVVEQTHDIFRNNFGLYPTLEFEGQVADLCTKVHFGFGNCFETLTP